MKISYKTKIGTLVTTLLGLFGSKSAFAGYCQGEWVIKDKNGNVGSVIVSAACYPYAQVAACSCSDTYGPAPLDPSVMKLTFYAQCPPNSSASGVQYLSYAHQWPWTVRLLSCKSKI